jgi:hypothetical protein
LAAAISGLVVHLANYGVQMAFGGVPFHAVNPATSASLGVIASVSVLLVGRKIRRRASGNEVAVLDRGPNI